MKKVVDQITPRFPWQRGNRSISTGMCWIEGQLGGEDIPWVSKLVCPRAPYWCKINKRLWDRATAFLRPKRNDIIISRIHAHAYMHPVKRGGREKRHFFSLTWCTMQQLQRNKFNPCNKKSPHRGDVMQNDYVWVQLSNIFACSQTNLQPILQWWQKQPRYVMAPYVRDQWEDIVRLCIRHK